MISKFEEALANCSREPIHIPCAIQPFGILIALDRQRFQSGQPLRLNMPNKASAWDAFVHRHRSKLIFELESVPVTTSMNDDSTRGSWVHTALATLESSTSLVALCQRACEQIKQLTGLDGVGLHYPASDIPPQARAISWTTGCG